jgi:hypothetical protein
MRKLDAFDSQHSCANVVRGVPKEDRREGLLLIVDEYFVHNGDWVAFIVQRGHVATDGGQTLRVEVNVFSRVLVCTGGIVALDESQHMFAEILCLEVYVVLVPEIVDLQA